uniref:Uncharacterized protein n=1 Tax=Rhizophora mucronata TaxID=61149 RepID=A0A2P2JDF4_RHIMU
MNQLNCWHLYFLLQVPVDLNLFWMKFNILHIYFDWRAISLHINCINRILNINCINSLTLIRTQLVRSKRDRAR